MKISPTSVSRVALALVLLAGAGVSALGQDHPESLLPPGFDEPVTPAPAPAPQSTRAPDSGTPAPLPSGDGQAGLGNEIAGNAVTAEQIDYSRYELPDIARHSLDRVGAVASGNPSFPVSGFGRADGRFLSVLMRRLDAPVASRWASIALRRALLSRIDTPRGVNGADFAAERAWLLIRMGEAVAARAVVQDVDLDNYTPKLLQIAMQVSLANADPGGICPIADAGAKMLSERGWGLAQAMCAGLAGEPARAGQLLQAARTPAGDIDRLLAEKILGLGAQSRRAVTIEWDGIAQLTAWRWGLATAAGEEVPESLYGSVGPQVRYWRALSPSVDPVDRVQSAELAAAQGVFSNAGLVDLYGEIEETGVESSSGEVAVARDLRAAFTAATVEDRIKALHTLWAEATSPRTQYARLVLTARAAAAIAPDAARADDADRLIASMLTAGLEAPALAWRGVAKRGTDGWAMLALVDPEGARVSAADFGAYRSAATARKAQFALAGLAGLGRLDSGDAQREAAALDVAIGATNSWTAAIDRAGEQGEAATVALLAAVGMQSRGWGAVTPEALFHIVAAFRAAGMADYARLIAVEAITRA